MSWLDRYDLDFPEKLLRDEATEEHEVVRKSGEEHEAQILQAFQAGSDVAVSDRNEKPLNELWLRCGKGGDWHLPRSPAGQTF